MPQVSGVNLAPRFAGDSAFNATPSIHSCMKISDTAGLLAGCSVSSEEIILINSAGKIGEGRDKNGDRVRSGPCMPTFTPPTYFVSRRCELENEEFGSVSFSL